MKNRIRHYANISKKAILCLACAAAVLTVSGAGTAYAARYNRPTGTTAAAQTAPERPTTASEASGSYISGDAAKEIALNHAGLSASEVFFKKSKLDREDRIMVYEIEFYYGNWEYEYEINATTGAILEYDIEWDD